MFVTDASCCCTDILGKPLIIVVHRTDNNKCSREMFFDQSTFFPMSFLYLVVSFTVKIIYHNGIHTYS